MVKARYLGVLALLAVSLTAKAAESPATRPAVDQGAMEWLKKSCGFLGGLNIFQFGTYSVTQAMLMNGEKVEFAKNQMVTVQRPKGVLATVRGDQGEYDFVYDGKTVTMANLTNKVYGQTAAPGTIDETVDMLATKYGMVLPLADLLVADPYKAMTGEIQEAEDLGSGWVFDIPCRHLAFKEAGIDWEIWIDEGKEPFPRKMVITYKNSPGVLQYEAYFTKWRTPESLPKGAFEFKAAEGMGKVDFAGPSTQDAQKKS